MNRLLALWISIAVTAAAAPPAPIAGCTPPPTGLWAWWPFDESAGNETVNLLGGPEGRFRNGPRPAQGRVAGALQFDGVNDYVDVPGDRVDPGQGDFSFAVWIRPSSTTGVRSIIDRRDIGRTVRGYTLYLWKGQPGFQLADATGPANCSTDPPVPGCSNYGSNVTLTNDEWHFVALSIDRQSKEGGKFYIDGKTVVTFDPTSRSRSLSAQTPLRIGAHSGTTPLGHFHGSLDELQFFRRALDAGELDALYRAGTCKDVSPTLVASAAAERTLFFPGVVILKLKEAPAIALRDALAQGRPFSALPFPPAIRELNRRFGARAVEPIFRALRGGAPGALERYFKLTIDARLDAAGASSTYARADGVAAADPDWIMHVNQLPDEVSALPGWQLARVDVANAWKKATGLGVVVAVVDTGILLNHTALQENLWTNKGEQPGNNIDDDKNGFVDDIHGWDFVGGKGDNDPTDDNGHGTHVAGTVAAAKSSSGVTGVAYDARLMALRALDAAGAGRTTELAQAICYATTNGAHVINNSWGAEERAPIIDDTISYSRSQGVVVVSAAGNTSADACEWTPGNAEGGLTVAATSPDDQKITMSNFGVKLDVGAPGQEIVSTGLRHNEPKDGTSMAAPHVSALAALLKERYPTWSAEEIRQAIRESAKDVGPAGFDAQTGFGRIDMGRALSRANPPPVASIDCPTNCKSVSGKSVQILGSSSAKDFRKYELSIAPGAEPQPSAFKLLAESSTAVTDGVLGSFDSLARGDGIYTLRLVTRTKDGNVRSEDRNVIKIDNMSKRGWPAVVHDGAMKSPMVADLDNDGRKEVILGTAVFQSDGTARPGWEVASAGFGRTNPAIIDVDGDGRLEIIAAEWESLDQFEASIDASKIGPVIYAYNADRVREKNEYDWKYVVENKASLAGNHHGIPSTISVGDLEGDSSLEVVFTVYFDVDGQIEGNEQTQVFILDAKTGKLEKSFAVGGRAISSVALAPRRKGPGRLIVISSDTALHVVDETGKPAQGWPQPQKAGGGLIDPVVADVDRDGEPDILAGRILRSLGGTVKKGFPPTGSGASTGSFGPFTSDCDMDVLLGGDRNTPYAVHKFTGQKSLGLADGGEDLVLELEDENGNAGAPIVADLDSDGKPDVAGPSRRGVESFSAALYAWKGSSPGALLPGFPRLLPAANGIIHSSAAVDDIDGDGMTDLLIAGDGLLHAWTLNAPFDAASNPWPMFQHDLAHTGYLPASATGDLWIEDTPRTSDNSFADNGREPAPSMNGQPVWLSRAMWVRNSAAGTNNDDRDHQNPRPGQLNQVNVWVRNRGCKTSGGEQLQLFAGKSTLGPPAAGWTPIATADIPAIPGGASARVRIPWTTTAATTPYALLARITSGAASPAETEPLESRVRRSNDLAWRNVQLVTAPRQTILVDVVNPTNREARVDLTFTIDGPFLKDGGRLEVDLRSISAMQNGKAAITAFPATLRTALMAAGTSQEIAILIDATTALSKKRQYVLDVTASIEGVAIGGASYRISGTSP